jgi:hypothetical protein
VAYDEPTLSFYSNAPGSGGNVTWDLTLPTDVSSTDNQSSLYAAAWVGLVVSDPSAWLGQCYVEVQLYPDFEWSSPTTTVAGVWSGAVVGWQIDPSSGSVDTCFYAPLYLNGASHDGYFSMSQGDAFNLTLLGYPGSAVGERVSISDVTSGHVTSVTLYNSTGGFPLDPAYDSNQFAGSLLWTPGGELPISFGFEIGRAGNPAGVHNNTFGGCNPGPGAPTPINPAVPCPSYDPVSWVNDTLTPWQIGTPHFYQGSSTTFPAQLSLSSSVGGGASIDARSQQTCVDRLGSAFCQYPWFGYSCSSDSFTFGAVDFASESNDFGEANEYPASATANPVGLPQYSTSDFSIPACGSSSYSVSTDTSGTAGGTVGFLSEMNGGPTVVSGVAPGAYAISANPPSGAGFGGWTVTGGLTISSSTGPIATLHVAGSGTVTADFTLSPAMISVTFASTTSGSAVVVTPGLGNSNGTGTTVVAGGTISLPAGPYALQAAPAPGGVFSRWSVNGGPVAGTVALPLSPVSTFLLNGGDASVTVNAFYVASLETIGINLTGFGDGTVTLGGHSFPYNSGTGYSRGNLSLSLGTYAATAVAAPGWTFEGWNYSPAAYLILFNATTNVSFDGAVASLTANFAANVITFNFAVADSGGRIAFNGVGPLSNGTMTSVLRGVYSLDALPFGYNTFLRWNVSDPAALWVFKATYPITRIQVNSTGNVTASFGPATNVSITFQNSPANAGSIAFNYATYSGASSSNSSLAVGSYLLRANAAPGFVFSSWTVTAPNTYSSGILSVNGPGGKVTANFVTYGYSVSFVTAASASVRANLSGQLLSSGDALGLLPGSFPLSAVVGSGATFLRWVPTGSITVANRSNPVTTLDVSGAGTLFAVVDSFSLTGVTSSAPFGEVDRLVTFTAQYQGVAPRSFGWSGLPTGCSGADLAAIACTPSASGAFDVVVTVTGPSGIPISSGPLVFSVNGALGLQSFIATRAVLDLGMSTTLTASTVGGASPLTYSYAPLPPGCVSANAPSISCQPTSSENTTVEVTVTDALGVARTGNLTLRVAPALVLQEVSASPTAMTLTIPFSVSTVTTGGSAPISYSYSGLPSSCASADLATLPCVASSAGNYRVNVSVSDAAGALLTGTTSVLVNPLPTISFFNATPTTLSIGGTLTLKIVASGGTGPLSYQISGLPAGCTSVNASSFTCQPNATGNFSLVAVVTDSDHVPSSQFPTIITVLATTSPSGGGSGGSFPWWVWAAIAVVILAAVMIGYLLLRRRPGTPTGTPAETPPPPPR